MQKKKKKGITEIKLPLQKKKCAKFFPKSV